MDAPLHLEHRGPRRQRKRDLLAGEGLHLETREISFDKMEGPGARGTPLKDMLLPWKNARFRLTFIFQL